MATTLSLLYVTTQSGWVMPRPPQPICTQLSLPPVPAAARRLGTGMRRTADNAPAASAERLRNERRFRAEFIYQQPQFRAQRLRLVRSVAYPRGSSSSLLRWPAILIMATRCAAQ